MFIVFKLLSDFKVLKRDMFLLLVKFEDVKVDLGKVWILVNFIFIVLKFKGLVCLYIYNLKVIDWDFVYL